MSAEPKHIDQPDDDIDTTAPQSEPEAWKMPEPVFRRTSGKLPKAFVDEVNGVMSSDEDVQGHSSDAPADADPQPIGFDATSDTKPKSGTLKILVLALALGAMIAFIVVLVSIVYFLFLR